MTNDEPLHIASNGDVQLGQIPTDDDLYWVGAMRVVFVESMRATHASALAMFCASVAGWMLLTAALLFGDRLHADTISLLWFVPLLLWTVSAVWSLRALSARRYRYFSNSPDSAHQAIVRIARRKYRRLFQATALWIAGVVAFVCIVAYQLVAGR